MAGEFPELRFRHVHLDFHTSEHIAGVGDDFDPEAFAEMLVRARVDSINCFARCHHGYIYYDTQAFPERRHPSLSRNLLREQIEACHARDIRCPIYVTVKWDHYTATQHPEWLVMDTKGRRPGSEPYEPGFYAELCLNSPYVDFLRAHVQEIFALLPVDGFWFDIVFPQDCSCRYCRTEMEAQGLDPSDQEVRQRFGVGVVDRFSREMTEFVRRFSPDCGIFFNGGHVSPHIRASLAAYSHLELESLPSGGWGYMHLPVTMRYARTLGPDCLGMTGKFHTAWGDFQSLKNEAALQFECFQMLALTGKCSVGDQLHPSGAMEQATYDLIGSVYAEVERKEPWCRGAKAVTDIAVFTPEEFIPERLPAPILGAVRMLQEGGHQFDLVDTQSDLSGYSVLILPDCIPVSESLARRLEQHLADGGALLASHRSGLDETGAAFALPGLGVSLKGPAPFSPDFLRPKAPLSAGLPDTEFVMYLPGMEVEASAKSEILAETCVPYFNRTYRHFCSHRHTPTSHRVGYPGVVRTGRAIYFAHPVFTQYQDNAPRWCKQLFLNALDLLLPEPLVRTDGPSTLVATLNEQAGENRWVLHLLHYIPERRGNSIDTVEDILPLSDLTLSVRTPRPVQAVRSVPQGEVLAHATCGARTEFVLPRLEGHQMIAIEFS